MTYSAIIRIENDKPLNALTTKVGVAPWGGSDFTPCNATFDTGATGSAIKESLAKQLGLKPTGTVTDSGVNSSNVQSTEYGVSVQLKEGVVANIPDCPGVQLSGDTDMLIGMDIISKCDFVITASGGGTQFAIGFPSELNASEIVK